MERPTFEQMTIAIDVLRWFRDTEHYGKGFVRDDISKVKVWLENERDVYQEWGDDHAFIQAQVRIAFESHKSAFENWREGEVKEYWIDDDGYLCIRYESGEWWHYKDLDLPFPTWW